jgi:ketosteroid isomerase-like protein
MKKYLQGFVLLMALQLVLLGSAHANQATQNAINTKYQNWVKAYQNADINPIVRELTSDFTAVLPGKRTVKRAEFVASARQVFDSILRTNSASARITNIKIEKNRTIVTVAQKLDLVLSINNDSNYYKESGTYRDTWVKVSGQWKIKRSEFLSGRVTLNGKPIKF